MTTICIANQKGGVGKTTTAVNLAAGLVEQGHKTLVVDLDAQCNATYCLRRSKESAEPNICDVLLDQMPLEKVIESTSMSGLDLIPAGESLASAELNLASIIGREQCLAESLKNGPASDYDYIIFDTGPHLGLLTVNALVATDYVLIPVSCEFLPLLGLKYLLGTVDKVRSRLHPNLAVLGYLLTMVDRRERITSEVENTLRERFIDKVFETTIRINTKQKSAPAEKKTIFEFEHSDKGKGTEDYRNLAREVLLRLQAGGTNG